MIRGFALFATVSLFIFTFGCGSSNTTSPPPAQDVHVSIAPTSGASLVSQTTQFAATVTGSTNTGVTWSVKENTGGTVNAGLYSAPWSTGTYHVVATSVADPTKSATATVLVSAAFAFIEKLPNGTSLPWSVTPFLGTLGADGKFTATNINDPGTGTPMDAAIYDLSLSSDGKKAVFTVIAVNGDATNIYTANSDGTQITPLTTHVPGSFVFDSNPQFSPDGQKVVYAHYGLDGSSTGIWVMNADGSNQQVVFSQPGASARFPTFSPDGTTIAAEIYQQLGGEYYDGIATMKVDGTNVQQLTGSTATNSKCDGRYFDEMPTFTDDGKQISFSEVCWPQNVGMFETVYIMNADGTNITKLHGDNTTFMSCQPRAFADRIVFSTNVDSPGTDQFQMYSINPDGSNLKRLTNTALYDGFSIAWMNYWGFGTGLAQKHFPTPAEDRVEHLRRLPETRRH